MSFRNDNKQNLTYCIESLKSNEHSISNENITNININKNYLPEQDNNNNKNSIISKYKS